MKILSTKIEESFVNFDVEFNSDEIKKAEQEVISSISKNIKINGYRPGKVPVEIVKKQISSDELNYKIANLLAQKNYNDLENSKEYKELDVVITGEWTISLENFDIKNNPKISYMFEKYPNVTFDDYKKLDLPNFDFKVDDETLEYELKFLLKASAKDVAFNEDEKISENDLISINLTMSAENEKEHKLSNRVFEVKENKSIIDFVKNVVGLKIKDSVSYDVVYPEDFFIKEFANKKGKINIEILNAYHLIIPELNSEFINSLGIERIKTKEQFLEQLKQDIVAQKLNLYKKANLNLIYDQIIKNSKIDFYPELLIKRQVQNFIYSYIQELRKHKLTLEDYLKKENITLDKFQNDIYLETKKSFLIESALSIVGEKEKVIASQEQIDSFYFTLAQKERVSVEEIKAKTDSEKISSSLLNSLIIDKLIELNNKTK